jgi:hypothetical protein
MAPPPRHGASPVLTTVISLRLFRSSNANRHTDGIGFWDLHELGADKDEETFNRRRAVDIGHHR